MRETNPYRASRQFERQILRETDKRAFVVYKDFVRSFLKVRVNSRKLREELRKAKEFRIEGDVYLNPKTGKPLTKKEWNIIKKSLSVAFRFIYDTDTEEAIAKKAVVLGKILTTMDTNARLNMIRLNEETEAYRDYSYIENEIEFAQAHAGEMITGLRDKARSTVISEILNGQRERIGPRELETRLFRTYVNINRDWRRIAETEIARNITNGYVLTELQKGTQYVRGLSSADACPYCRANIDGQVMLLSEKANSTGYVFDKQLNKEIPVIWPGKSNWGRSRRNWWESIPAHPHCRCSLQQWVPGIEESSKRIEDRLAALLAAEGAE